MIRYIRTIAPTQKLIVGFAGWNRPKKMIASKPFAEPNIIHTFSELDVPNTWWKWGGNFDMLEKGTTKIADRIRKAVDSFKAANRLKK